MSALRSPSISNEHAKFLPAVRNIVHNCMRLSGQDRFVVITDQARLDIGHAIFNGGKNICDSKLVVIEDYIDRPAKLFPEKLAKEIVDFAPTASIYAATGQVGELPPFRRKLIDLLTVDLNARHGHMINVNESIMLDGMAKDYAKIYKTTHALYKILTPAKKMVVTDRHGTQLEVTFSHEPGRKWKASDGVPLNGGQWGNLPDGEVFTCPEVVNGVVVAWEAGDHFSEKYGVLQKPLTLNIQDSLIKDVHCDDKSLELEFIRYISEYENGNRMGEFAVGCLIGLNKLIGNLLQDEKFPGIHMAFGHNYSHETGAPDWNVESHVDVIPLNVNATVDDIPLLVNGAFVEGII